MMENQEPYIRPSVSRREFLWQAGAGFGSVALTYLLAQEAEAQTRGADDVVPSLLAAKPPMFEAKAKSVIFLFMSGGPSHVDTFDPKSALIRRDGQGHNGGRLMRSPFGILREGQSGIEVSGLYPNVAKHVDEICFVRSMVSESGNHAPAVLQMNTGFLLPGHPSVGSWVTYGLGTVNQNLPAFVVIPDPRGGQSGSPSNWTSGFMPAAYQGTVVRSGKAPILDLKPERKGYLNASVLPKQQELNRQLLRELNEEHLRQNPGDSDLEARIASYELAANMQRIAPKAFNIAAESEETKELYGLNDKRTETFGRQCLLAARLRHFGVRFLQVYNGGGGGSWDSHDNIATQHGARGQETDRPIAGLLTDLKRRGLLDSTLVVWGGEFGRTPTSQGNGRNHHTAAHTIWMAGGGVRGGTVIGGTDEIGDRPAAENEAYQIRNLHATILYALGLRENQLTYLYNGRYQKLTNTGAKVIPGIFA